MSTYKELRGLRVKYVPTDTTSPSTAAAGDVWYNSASYQLKAYVGRAAWSAGAPMATGRHELGGGIGIQTAAVAFGGVKNPNTLANNTEEYDGSGWAGGENLNTARKQLGGAGTLTAGLAFGGHTNKNESEEYDGTNWTEGPNLASGRSIFQAGLGIQTAAMAVMGTVTGTALNNSESYDGSSWTEGPNVNTVRNRSSAFGTQTAGVIAGGDAGDKNQTEEYNGSSWTSVNNLNTGREDLAAAGILTNGLCFGGRNTADVAVSETYDGTTWTEGPDLASAVQEHSGTGASSLAALKFGKAYHDGATEEYNNSFQVVTAGAWASGGALNTSRRAVGINGIGPSQNAALCVSGYPPSSSSDIKNVESYDGSSWTEVGDVNLSRYRGSCAGTTTAGLFFGGNSDVTPGGLQTLCEEYDGSSWTESGDLPAAIEGGGSFGTQTAAVRAGGSAPPFPNYQTNTDEYNGSSWTAVPATISQAVSVINGVGTETAGLIWGGAQSPNPPSTSHPSIATTQTYNGSAFTTVNACIEQINGQGCGGTQTAAFGVGGGPGTKTTMQTWDGTNWSTGPALGTGRNSLSGGGTATAGLAFAGSPGGGVEEFTAASTADTASTIDFD